MGFNTIAYWFLIFCSVRVIHLSSVYSIPMDVNETDSQVKAIAMMLGKYKVFSIFERLDIEKSLLNDEYIIIQQRENNQEAFNRTWFEYKWGFGDLKRQNYWIGNELLNMITTNFDTKLRVDLERINGVGGTYWAEYDIFEINSEDSGYTMHVSGYTGDAGDSLQFNNGMKFSTVDIDNDNSERYSCGDKYESGWWFNDCFGEGANLNGKYLKSETWSGLEGIRWLMLTQHTLAKTKMSIKLKKIQV